jgi:hypothetical protein
MYGHRLKLQRALEHLEALQAAVDGWAEDEPCVVSYECEVATRKHTLTQRTIGQPTEPIFCFLIGDAVHNMRQGLDHLAYRLAITVYQSDPPPNARICMWPIRTKAELPSRITNYVGPQNNMPPGMYAAIEGFQTDAGSDGVLLDALHWLDNLDKHRFPPLVAGLAKSIDLGGLNATGGVEISDVLSAQTVVSAIGAQIKLGAFENGKVIIKTGSEMNVTVSPTASIAFDKTNDVAPGELVLPLLESIRNAIVNRVLPTMEAFL